MSRNRAYTRHHEHRIKEKVKDYHGGWASKSPRTLGIVANTPAICSCDMCGNPRRKSTYGDPRTLQEIKAEIDYEQQLEELTDEKDY